MILTEQFYILIGLNENGSSVLAVSTSQAELILLASHGPAEVMNEFEAFSIRASNPHPLLAQTQLVTHPGSPTPN